MARNLFIVLFLTGLTLAAGWFLLSDWKTEALVKEVRNGDVRDSVTGNVRVLPESSYELRSRAQGMVTEAVLLPYGRAIDVERNQTLVQLDTGELRRKLNQTMSSKRNYDKRREATSPTAIQLELEEKELKDLEILARERKISSLDLNKKQNLVQRLRAQLKQETLELELEGNSLRTTLENLEAELQRTIVRSPIKGEFVSSVVAPGDMVLASQVLGRINSHDQLIEVSLNEEDYAGMREGLSAGVTLFSFGSQIFQAKVDRLSSLVDPKNGRRKLYLKIDPPRKLPAGGAGRAEIIKSVRKQTLLIPRKALVGTSVFVEKDGVILIREVRTGARNLTEVEILDGLKEGERVVVGTPHLFREGQSVKSTLVDSD